MYNALRRTEILDAPVASNLVTVNLARDYLGGIQSDDAAATALLATMINHVSRQVVNHLGYDLAYQRRMDTFDLSMVEMSLDLSGSVKIAIESVKAVDPTPGSSAAEIITNYIVANGQLYKRFSAWQSDASYEVTYHSGYTTTAAGVDAPDDIQRAALILIAQTWASRGRSPDVISEGIDGVASVDYEPVKLPLLVVDLLQPYRRLAI